LGGLLAVVMLSLIINSVGLDWGRSGLVPWQPDSIEGITTVREMPRMFGQWTYKYPRGHFFLNAIFYYPLLEHWKKHPIVSETADGRAVSQVLTLDRLDLLAKISRLISVAMGVGTVLAVFFTSRLLFGDYSAGLLAALTLTLSQLFVFNCHLGNVDVPCVFWFAWGIYWAVKAARLGKYRHFVLMGLFFSYSISTKDAVGGYLIGMAPAFWLATISRSRAEGRSLKAAMLSVFSKKVLIAVLVFLFLFVMLQNIIISPGAFAERMSFWSGERGVSKYNKQFSGQLPLLWDSCRMLYGSFGWPLSALLVVSLLYCSVKYTWQSGFATIPLVAFYVIVLMNIRLVQARYFLPAYPGLALLAGKSCADWLKSKRIHIALRIFPLATVCVLSLLYCIGLDLEMLSDTRVRTEQWFAKNVPPPGNIGVGIYNKIYAPRLHLKGYRMTCPWRSASIQERVGGSSLYPDYLIMTPVWKYVDEEVEGKFREELFGGKLDYDEVARFGPKYVYPARTVFGFAGWPVESHPLLSPEIVVFKKRAGAGGGQRSGTGTTR